VQYRIIDRSFFRTAGIPFVEGREPQRGERAVAVINQTAAHRYWPRQDVLGHEVVISFPQAPAPWRPRITQASVTVVGVARDIAETSPSAPIPPQIFVLYRDIPSRLMSLAVRTIGEPTQIRHSVLAGIQGIEREQLVDEIKPWNELVRQTTDRANLATALLTGFAVLALIMAIAGVYGVLSYSVVQRSGEIGVRMAVGARGRDVLMMTMMEGAKIALAGVAVGSLLAWICVRTVAARLPGVAVWHFAPLTAAGGVLAFAVLVATYVPARRATQIDPMTVLRAE
jgi:hypothetical protein